MLKEPILRDKKWLDLIRSQQVPCAVTGLMGTDANPVVPAHMGITGKGVKAPDNEVLPMLDTEHRASHGQIECSGFQTYWCKRFMNDKHLLLDVIKAYARQMYEANKE